MKPIWINKDIDKLLFKVLTPHDLYIEYPNAPICINKDTKKLKSLITMILNHAPDKSDFYSIMHKDTKNRLFYLNGYYDFIQSKFIEYDDNNIPFTTFVIEREYKVNESLVDDVYKRIFYPIFDVDYDENNEPIDNNKFKYMKYTIYQ